MKIVTTIIALLLQCFFCLAQDQLTNSGNFQTFTGATIGFFGNFANNGTFTDGADTILFAGISNQAISGSSAITFNNLKEKKSAGVVSLSRNITVAGILTLTAGQLNLNAQTLTLSNAASTAVVRTSGYILSEANTNLNKVTWSIGADASAHVFPFGTAAAAYIPFTLTLTAGNIGNVTVSTYPTAANNTPLPTTVGNVNRAGSDNSANVVDRFWQIDKDGASGTATMTFVATAAEVGTITTLRAQRWGSAWEAPISGQSSTATSATVPGVTNFSPWTLSGNSAPLPVEMISFIAAVENSNVKLDWETATEVNNNYFIVQRSTDGKNFKDIGKVYAGAPNDIVHYYNFLDKDAVSGVSYYRLKQTDIDGAYEYSEVRKVDIERTSETFVDMGVYPNPTNNNTFSLIFTNNLTSAASITIHDLIGKVIFQKTMEQGEKSLPIHLLQVPAGLYIIEARSSYFYLVESVVLK